MVSLWKTKNLISSLVVCGMLLFRCQAYERAYLVTIAGGIVEPSQARVGFGIEYKGLFGQSAFRPQVGAMTTEFNSAYLYAGLAFDFIFKEKLALTPSFSPGVYFQGNNIDLGYPIEFRSCFEAAYIFRCGWRAGAEFFHLSNASLSRRNPGFNALFFFLSVPLSL